MAALFIGSDIYIGTVYIGTLYMGLYIVALYIGLSVVHVYLVVLARPSPSLSPLSNLPPSFASLFLLPPSTLSPPLGDRCAFNQQREVNPRRAHLRFIIRVLWVEERLWVRGY